MKEMRLSTVLTLALLCLPSLAFAAEPVAPAMEPTMAAPAMTAPAAMVPDMAAPMAAVPAMEPVMEAVMAAPMAPVMEPVMAAPKVIPAAVVNKVVDDDAKLEAAAAAKAAANTAVVADAAVTPDPAPAAIPPAVAVQPTMEATPAQAAKSASVGKTDPWWKVLLGGLISILLVFVGTLATGLGALLIKWIAKKIKVTDAEMLAMVDHMYDSAIELGINFADQQARKLGANPDANGKRLEWAIEKAKEAIKELGLAEKAKDWITTRIEAKLGVKNVGKPLPVPTEPPKAADSPK